MNCAGMPSKRIAPQPRWALKKKRTAWNSFGPPKDGGWTVGCPANENHASLRPGAAGNGGALLSLLFALSGFAPAGASADDIGHAIKWADQIVCGTIEAATKKPTVWTDKCAIGACKRDITFRVDGVLVGPPELKGELLLLKNPVWNQQLVPIAMGECCVLFLRLIRRDSEKETGEEKIVLREIHRVDGIAPWGGQELPHFKQERLAPNAKEKKEIKKILLRECLASLQKAKDPRRQREIILAISSIASPQEAALFLPYLESDDEWLRRAALNALLFATQEERYVAAAAADLRSFFDQHLPQEIWREDDDHDRIYSRLSKYYSCLDRRNETGETPQALLPLCRLIAEEAPDLDFRTRAGFFNLRDGATSADAPYFLPFALDDRAHIRAQTIQTLVKILGAEAAHERLTDFLKKEGSLRAAAEGALRQKLKAEWEALGGATHANVEAWLWSLECHNEEESAEALQKLDRLGWRTAWGIEKAFWTVGRGQTPNKLQELLEAWNIYGDERAAEGE